MDSTHIEEHDTFTHRVYYSAKRAVKSHASGGNVLIVATILAPCCCQYSGNQPDVQ